MTLVSLPALLPSLAPLLALARAAGLESPPCASILSSMSPDSVVSYPVIAFISGSISVIREAVLTRSSQKKKELKYSS